MQWLHLFHEMRYSFTASLQTASRICSPCMKAAQFSKVSNGQRQNGKKAALFFATFGIMCARLGWNISQRTNVVATLHVQDPYGSIPSRVVRGGTVKARVEAAAAARRLQGLQQQLQELEPEWCALHHDMACVNGFCDIHIAALIMLDDEQLVVIRLPGRESKESACLCGQESAQRMQDLW